MLANTTAIVARKPNARAAISNGKRMHARGEVDGRSASARRYRDLVASLIAEHGGGSLSTAEAALIRTAAAIMLKAEQLQVQIVNGASVDADEVIRLSSEARRILASLKKRAVPAPQKTLAQYLAEKQAAAPATPKE